MALCGDWLPVWVLQVRQQIHMASRPLPSVPPGASPATSGSSSSNIAHNSNNSSARASPRQRPTSTYHCRSFDDHHFLPSSSSSPSPLSSAKHANGVSIRSSPRRKQPRPLSEIATGSGGVLGSQGAAGAPGSKGYDNWHPMSLYEVSPAPSGASPKQSPRHLPSHPPAASSSSSSSSSSAAKTSAPPHTTSSSSASSSSPQHRAAPAGDGGVYIYGPSPGGVVAEIRAGGKGPRFESGPRQGETAGGRGCGCPSGNTEPVLRYQNDSPFHLDDQDAAGKIRQG